MIDGRSLGANEHFLSHKLPFRVSRLAMALKGHTVYNSVVENATFSSTPVRLRHFVENPPIPTSGRQFQSGQSPNYGAWDRLFQVHVVGFQG